MISIRKIKYTTEEKAEQAFSRLNWAVEKVDGLVGQLIIYITKDTNRPWVGVYNSDDMTFGLIEPRNFFTMNLFQIVVRGRITNELNSSIINIKMRLGWFTLLFYVFVYIGTILMIYSAIINGDNMDVSSNVSLTLWLFTFPVLGTFLLNRKLNKVEKKVKELFNIE